MIIYFVNGVKAGSYRDLNPAGISIGREADNDIDILEEGVSRYHSRIELDNGVWKIKDLGSINGTRLNGEMIYGCASLKPGDEIKIGSHVLRFVESKTQVTTKTSEESPVLKKMSDPTPSRTGQTVNSSKKYFLMAAPAMLFNGLRKSRMLFLILITALTAFLIVMFLINGEKCKTEISLDELSERQMRDDIMRTADEQFQDSHSSKTSQGALSISKEKPAISAEALSSSSGVIAVESTPSGAKVILNGEERGRTPFSSKLKQGQYKIRVEREQHAAFEDNIFIEKDQRKEIYAKLELMSGILVLKSDPVAAGVSINNKEYGCSPLKVSLPPGRYEILVAKHGYKTEKRIVELDPAQTCTLEVPLDGNTGGMDLIVSPSRAIVYLDGRKYDDTPPAERKDGFKVLEFRDLPVGEHSVTIECSRAVPERTIIPVSIKKGEISKLKPVTLWIADTTLELKDGSRKCGRISDRDNERIIFEPEPQVKMKYRLADIKIIPIQQE